MAYRSVNDEMQKATIRRNIDMPKRAEARGKQIKIGVRGAGEKQTAA